MLIVFPAIDFVGFSLQSDMLFASNPNHLKWLNMPECHFLQWLNMLRNIIHLSKGVAQHGPESVAQYAPELVAQYGAEFT
jgi:hypothetical protein